MNAIKLSDISPKEIATGYLAKIVHSEKMSLSFIEVKAGHSVNEHSHPNEQIAIVQKGIFRLVVDGESIEFGEGELVIIPSNVKHSGYAITDCILLDVFTPVREDFKNLQ